MTREVLERGLADILSVERRLRKIAEDVNVELRGVLTEIAYRTAGEALEERRRADPMVPATWSANEWREFFSGQPKHNGPGWGNDGLPRRNGAAVRQREGNDRIENEPSVEIERPEEKPESGNGRHRETAEALYASAEPKPGPNAWPDIPKRPPARFASKLSTGIRWRREALSLHLMAVRGWSARLEILEAVGELSGVSPKSGSLKRMFDGLVVGGLVAGEVLVMMLNQRSKLAVARLTSEGIELSRLLGWEPVESDWERLTRLHQGNEQPAHTAGVLAFGYHARRRGWKVEILPLEDGATQPDVSLRREEQRIFVEVEFEGGNPVKWRNLAELQGFVALCAPTPEKRASMVSECKLDRLRGKATDLESLIQSVGLEGSLGPVWLEEW